MEGNTVFTYLDAFCKDYHFQSFLQEYQNLDELKEHYVKGGVSDVKVKRFLNEILQSELNPIRERRLELQKDVSYIYDKLKEGTLKARKVASSTLSEVKKAMKLNYFD